MRGYRYPHDAKKRHAHYARMKGEGSCQDCGAEAIGGTTRCTRCGQRNARASKMRDTAKRRAS